jgi:uncharacterized repeat protein (TIGR01451 family)
MRFAALVGVVVTVACAVGQEPPGLLPSTLPRAVPDEGILPAQAVVPNIRPTTVAPSAAVNPVAVPVVSLDVIVPQAAAAAAGIPCKLIVKNNSNADAYSVQVRVPTARLAASEILKVTPTPVQVPNQQSRQYVWKFPTLRAGESKTISFDLKPDATLVNNGELGLKGFVSFEHGVEVVTKLGTADLVLEKTAPKDAGTGESIPVSVRIRNNGAVPLHDLKLIETVSAGYPFAEGTGGEEGVNPQQRVWKLGTLQPGETRPVSYRLVANKAGDVQMSSAVSTAEGNQKTKEAVTKVMTAGLSVKLTGPREVTPGEPATYAISVKNTGELPMRNVRVSGAVPDGCRATKMTNGGRMGRDRIDWVVPELKPGVAYDVRFSLVGDAAGKRTVTAVAVDSRGKEVTDTRETSFAASADLHWESYAEPTSLAVGKTGAFTVRVKNSGGDAARNVTLKVELPPEIRRTAIRPRDAKEGGQEIVFKPETIPSGATRDFVIEFKAEKPGRAYFNLRLEADALGDKPMLADKMIVVTQQR